jgi:hypothetical protein
MVVLDAEPQPGVQPPEAVLELFDNILTHRRNVAITKYLLAVSGVAASNHQYL